MPNYCENELTISGSNNDIDRFYLENKLSMEEAKILMEIDLEEETELSFVKSAPIPPEEQNCSRQVQEWGTKWDASEIHADKSDTEIRYYFQTAWSPPVAWLEKASQRYPDLEFEMESKEPGCDFYVHLIVKNGEQTFSKISTFQEYIYEKYKINERLKKVYRILSEYPDVTKNIITDIYQDDEIHIENMEEFIDQSPDDIEDEDEDFKFVFQILQQEIDVEEETDARWFICDAIDEFFNEHKKKNFEEIMSLITSKANE
jgi:hypothetical protein